jgi:isopentenyl-diphosphate delta-isomerase
MDQQPDETDTSDNHIGVRRAAVRKLEHELGLKTKVEQFKVRFASHVPRQQLPILLFIYYYLLLRILVVRSHVPRQPITRIKYGARSNDKWGENEIDYILFCQLDHVELNLNKNEVFCQLWFRFCHV